MILILHNSYQKKDYLLPQVDIPDASAFCTARTYAVFKPFSSISSYLYFLVGQDFFI